MASELEIIRIILDLSLILLGIMVFIFKEQIKNWFQKDLVEYSEVIKNLLKKNEIKFSKYYEKKFEVMIEFYSLMSKFTNNIQIVAYTGSKSKKESLEDNFYKLRKFTDTNIIFLREFEEIYKDFEKISINQISNFKDKDSHSDKIALSKSIVNNRNEIPKFLEKVGKSIEIYFN